MHPAQSMQLATSLIVVESTTLIRRLNRRGIPQYFLPIPKVGCFARKASSLDYSRECVWQNLKNSVIPSIANAYMLEKGLFEC